jgi:hypothetical protein
LAHARAEVGAPALCLRMRGGITIKKLASLGDVKEMPEKLCEYLEKAIEGIYVHIYRIISFYHIISYHII